MAPPVQRQRADKFDRILQSWETASKENDLADFSVCTTWGIKHDHVYLLHVMRKRMEYPELKRTVKAQEERWNAKIVLIEDKSSGTQLIQDLRAENLSAVQGVKADGDKVMRMQAQTTTIEKGFVRLRKETLWLDIYLDELAGFRNPNTRIKLTRHLKPWRGLQTRVETQRCRSTTRS